MNNVLPWFRLTALSLLLLVGCAGAPSPRCAPECVECRDFAVQELKVHRSGRHFQSETRLPRVHTCSCCKVEVTLYEQDGKPMLRCPKCAPEGVECAACELGDGTKAHTHGDK